MKMSKIILFFLISLILTNNVYAIDCPNADLVNLRKSASEFKATYDEATGIREPGTYGPPDGYTEEEYVSYYDYFEVKFLNINENIFIKVTNNINDEEKTINYKDTDNGTYKFDWKDTSKVVTFTYKIYASNKTNCNSYELKTGRLTLPAYNPYHMHNKCVGNEDNGLCHKYVNFDITYDSFIEKIDKIIEEQQKQEEQNENENNSIIHQISTFYKNNKTIILIVSGSVILVGGFIVGLVIRKKKRRAI